MKIISFIEKRQTDVIEKILKHKKAPKEDDSNKLLLTAIITDSVVTLGAKSGFLPSLFYQEFHHYIAKDDQADFTVKFDPSDKEAPAHPTTQRPMEIYERYDIYLYATDETYAHIKECLYSKFGEMMTDVNSLAVSEEKGPPVSVTALVMVVDSEVVLEVSMIYSAV